MKCRHQLKVLVLLPLLALGCEGTIKVDSDALTGDSSTDGTGDGHTDPVPEPSVDTVPDPTPDPIPDPTPDPGTDPGAGGCADGTDEQTFGSGQMVGCAGSVYWPSRDDLCAAGWSACSAAQWMDIHGVVAPTHNYWTDDDLGWGGEGPGNCVATPGGYSCGWNMPMRVCSGHEDPEGNRCNWIDCGYESPTPNEHFGGCQDNPTAGTLCCR